MISPRLKSQPGIAAALVCALSGAVVFQFFGNANHGYIDTSSLFWWWIYQWLDPASETEHAWLVLGISAWLFVRSLRSTRNAEDGMRNGAAPRAEPGACPGAGRSRSALGVPRVSSALAPLAAMIGGLGLHGAGFVGQQARLSILGLLLFTWGALRLAGGRRWGAAAAFPVAFLGFALPINVLDSLGFWLRLGVVDAGASLAHAAGVAVVRSGTQLAAPDQGYHYDVAAACSGVRSLTALAALSLLIGYLRFRSWWRRGLMVLLCLPLVFIGNVARIVAIVAAAQAGGPRAGDLAHGVMGYAVFALVLGGVLAGAAALGRWLPEAPAAPVPSGAAGVRNPAPADLHREGEVWRVAAVAATVVGLALLEMAFLHRWTTLPPRGEVGVRLAADGRNPVELPPFLGHDWVGWPAAITAVERDILPPDTGYSRVNFVSTRASRQVFLSIVLSGRDRTSLHRPELCLVGQGWTIEGRGTHRFAYPGRPAAAFPATLLRVRRSRPGQPGAPGVPQLVVYWFVGGDRVVATPWQRMGWDAWNRVAHGRVDRWAYVLLQTDAADGEVAALARLQSVLDATLPVFQRPMRR